MKVFIKPSACDIAFERVPQGEKFTTKTKSKNMIKFSSCKHHHVSPTKSADFTNNETNFWRGAAE